MALLETAVTIVHLLFAGLWTGGVVFVALGVVSLSDRDGVGAAALRSILDRLTLLSRVSALVLLLTGGHMAAERYTADSLTGSGDGHLVLTMVLLWAVLAALVEIGASRIDDAGNAAAGRTVLYGAAVVAIGLLVDAGLLVT